MFMQILVAITLLFHSSDVVFADELPVSIAVHENDVLFPDYNEGPYGTLLSSIEEKSTAKFAVKLMPSLRVRQSLYSEQPKVDCEFPSAFAHLSDDDMRFGPFLESEPLNTVAVYIVTRPEDAVLRNIEDLSGLRVGAIRGYGYGPILKPMIEGTQNHNVVFDLANSEENSIRMLYRERVDALIAYAPDVLNAAQQLEFEAPNFDASAPLFVVPDALVCRDTPETQKFLTHFNSVVKSMRQSGELETILGQYMWSVE